METNNKPTYKPAYANCVLLVFEDHNYYDDSDSWTVYYNGNTKEIVEEYWTTRGYCPTCNADPKDIQYSLHNCPKELLDEIISILRKDVLEKYDFAKMAEQLYSYKYKYQMESAIKCREEFMAAVPEVLAQFSDVWQLCKMSNMVHTYTDFEWKAKEYATEAPLYKQIASRVKTEMVAVRKRAKAVYGKQYDCIVKTKRFKPADYYNAFSYYVLIVEVDGYDKPFYLKPSSVSSEIEQGSKISFTGILVNKDEYKYYFVNKMRIVADDDILAWH